MSAALDASLTVSLVVPLTAPTSVTGDEPFADSDSVVGESNALTPLATSPSTVTAPARTRRSCTWPLDTSTKS